MTLSSAALPPRPAWIGHLLTFLGVAAASYATTVATGVLKRLAEGKPLDGTVLTTLPVDPSAYWFVPVVAAIVLLEAMYVGWRESPLRRLLFSRSPTHRSDVFFFSCDVVALSPMLTVALTIGLSAAFEAWLSAPRTWRPAADLSLWFAIPLLFLSVNFIVYWAHRFMHTPLMWPLHAVHHAAEDMTALSTFRHHPLDNFVGGFPAALLAAILAFPLDAVFAVEVCSGIFTVILHTKLPAPAWFERHVVAGPRFHGIHHSADAADHCSNLALLPILDRLFGTFRWHDKPLRFGVDDSRFDSGQPVRDIGAVLMLWLGGLRRAAAASFAWRTPAALR